MMPLAWLLWQNLKAEGSEVKFQNPWSENPKAFPIHPPVGGYDAE
jgi:hypothetical protein